MSDGDWGSGAGGASWGGGGDSFTERSSQGWFSRIGNALVGIPIGLLLFVGSIVLLFWNEGRSVTAAKTQAEGRSAVVSAAAETCDPANDGKLVHLSGLVTTTGALTDPDFLISANAIRLQRAVSMYVWKEHSETHTRKRMGGGQERTTTYTYTRDWSDHPTNSRNFKQPSGHENPTSFPFKAWSGEADKVKLGAYVLSADLVKQINKSEPIPVSSAQLDALPSELKKGLKLDNDRFYLGDDPSSPRVGDVRIEFHQVLPTIVSLLAQQSGNTFQPYQTQAGGAISRLQLGTVAATEMFAAAEAENRVLTWILRLVGFILMAIGVSLVFGPLSVFADVIPLFGSIVGLGTGFVAFGIALVFTPLMIAIAWLAYRPVVSIATIAIAGGLLLLLTRAANNRRKMYPPKGFPRPS